MRNLLLALAVAIVASCSSCTEGGASSDASVNIPMDGGSSD